MSPHAAPLAVAEFLLQRSRAAFGARADQGARRSPNPAGGGPWEGALRTFAERRVCGVPELVVQGLLAWVTEGRPAHVVTRIPRAEEVLVLQGEGARYVSLVDDATALAFGDPRHPDGRTFVLHDLCHLEKFTDPLHHRGQRGFFHACRGLLHQPAWLALEATLDDQWRLDRDYVFADMNGSAIFLFAALKMKLKMAVRRHLGKGGVTRGAFSPEEQEAWEEPHQGPQDRLLAALGLTGDVLTAARRVSTRRDAPTEAEALLEHFEGCATESGHR